MKAPALFLGVTAAALALCSTAPCQPPGQVVLLTRGEGGLDLYRSISQALQPPAVFVYLRASIWTLISRIRRRGRDYEQNIDKEYLAQLNIAYDHWAKRAAANHRVLVIETDQHDILKEKEWSEGVLLDIYRAVQA